jgi:TolB protein
MTTAQQPQQGAATTPAATRAALDPNEASTNRLLVVGIDGNLFTITPDGSSRFPLTTDAGPQRSYTQPTWSATGERIAWTLIERADGVRGSLITTSANGTTATRTATLFPPFYLYWSPDDSKVAYLSSWLRDNQPTIALHVADIVAPTDAGSSAARAVAATPVGVGQPFYFSWAPSSDRMIAHVGNREVILIDLVAQEPTVLVEDSANFAAPQWVGQDGASNRLLYVIQDENTAQLILSDAAGENEEFLTYLARQDFVSFSMNAPGNQIAYIETAEMVGFNAFGPLFLYDLEREIFEQLSNDPAIAFFWSPNGTALYFLTVEPTAEQIWLRVNVWDGVTVRQYARFVPSPSFARDYLPFADQYMQSMRFWAPDSSAVVYTGQAENGTAGVWVQPIAEGAAPRLVVAGTFATWSPR